MTEQEAKEYVKLYNDVTGQNYSINNDSGFDKQSANLQIEIPEVEFNELTAKEQREYVKKNSVNIQPEKRNPETKDEKLETYNLKEQKRQEIVDKKIEVEKTANIKQQEISERRSNPEYIQYGQNTNQQGSGIDSRQIQIMIALLEKIAANTSIGLS